ncbi:hypothetical protein QBC47DRAFT_404260 [Echria macrotheca]|uniref:Uncharacterized protein n=1 Tax=Echria macrotheca TaxID=438768 RepID=A0AAJ0B726_9PEZI|nr:hypothetical protein QBC47DRAFT_404260 [Echria macrotheca]
MKLSVVFATFSAAVLASALPADLTTSADRDRKYNITFCKKEDYYDCYQPSDVYTGTCYQLDSDYNNRIESVKHGRKVNCYYYTKRNCKGDSLYGSGDFQSLPSNWKDQITSWYCEEDTSSTGDRDRGRGDGRDRHD